MLILYTKNNCAHCLNAKNFLQQKNVNFFEINIEQDHEARQFIQSNGHRTVPQIYMDGKIFVENGWQGLSRMSADEILAEIDLRHSLRDQTI